MGRTPLSLLGTRSDLVRSDIHLKNELSVIGVSLEIQCFMYIPGGFLTVYLDEVTVNCYEGSESVLLNYKVGRNP